MSGPKHHPRGSDIPFPFDNRAYRLKQLIWAGAFLAVLAAMLFPLILLSAGTGHAISIYEQGALIALATVAIQWLRGRSVWEAIGRPDRHMLSELGLGCALGMLLMLAPALLLWTGGWVGFRATGTGIEALLTATFLMAGVAIAEELLFRGILFQRLVEALGAWPAQVLIAALFTLTHLGNPGMEGATKLWAGANIFLASIMFGLAYLKTRSLALPVGLHFMANMTQGVILGFGVSGETEPRLLAPVSLNSPEWLTGGPFGLEASLPGLVAVVAVAILIASTRFGRRSPAEDCPCGPV